MRIAVLGAGGLLGREFTKYSEVIPFYHKDCDITSRFSVQQMLACRPNVVINCAGIVRSKVPNYNTLRVIEVNSLAPHLLACECSRQSVNFIQVSTDCVFDGKSQSNYNELSQPTPEDFYAKTKLVGEVEYLTVRTSFIGPSDGLLAWAHRAKTVVGYDEEYWNGLSSYLAAEMIMTLAQSGYNYHPVVHLGGQEYSKYEVLKIANEVFKWDLDIQKGPTPPDRCRSRILTSEYLPTVDLSLGSQLELMK